MFGPAGAGKSRLVHEFLARLGDEATVARGALPPLRRGHHVLADRASSSGGRRDRRARPARAARRKLRLLLPATIRARATAAPLLGDRPRSTRRPSEETFWGVRKLFEHLAAQRPLVAVFDDIQWGEPTFLDLLEYLADWRRAARRCSCSASRAPSSSRHPARVGDAEGERGARHAEPLTARRDRRAHPGPARGRRARARGARADHRDGRGQPAVRRADAARCSSTTGRSSAATGGGRRRRTCRASTIPPTISALLTARLDRLDARERAVSSAPRSSGACSWWAAVAETGGEVRRTSISHLQSLTRKELIRPDYSENGREARSASATSSSATPPTSGSRRASAPSSTSGSRTGSRSRRAHAREFEEILGYHLEQAYTIRTERGSPTKIEPSDVEPLPIWARPAGARWPVVIFRPRKACPTGGRHPPGRGPGGGRVVDRGGRGADRPRRAAASR